MGLRRTFSRDVRSGFFLWVRNNRYLDAGGVGFGPFRRLSGSLTAARALTWLCAPMYQVWNAVDTHKRKSFTSLIHGKYAHEETVATASFADVYIVVKNLKELKVIEEYIMNGGDKEAFMTQVRRVQCSAQETAPLHSSPRFRRGGEGRRWRWVRLHTSLHSFRSGLGAGDLHLLQTRATPCSPWEAPP